MRVHAGTLVRGSKVSEAEALWYDRSRWPAFIDGFGHLVKAEGDWPRAGARTVWDSPPNGRGRVLERVTDYEARVGQTAEVEDPRMEGTQRVSFRPGDEGVEVMLELEYRLKRRDPLQRLVDLLFIRRTQRDSLRRTLVRFGRELAAERELT